MSNPSKKTLQTHNNMADGSRADSALEQEDQPIEAPELSVTQKAFAMFENVTVLDRSRFGQSWGDLKGKLFLATVSASDVMSSGFASTLALLQPADLLKWTESLTKGAPTAYDKAMDHIGDVTRVHGNEHRLFDGGHTLWGSWRASAEAATAENHDEYERLLGCAEAYMKDFTTIMGMPLATVDKQTFDQWVDSVAGVLPGLDRRYLYDLLSFDAIELCASSLSAAAVLFALNGDDQKKLAEVLGSMGVSSVASANPLLGLLTIAATAYVYRQQQQIDILATIKGGGLTAVSAAIFSILGFPVLVELVIVITLSTLLKKHVIDNAELASWLRAKVEEEVINHAKDLGRLSWVWPGLCRG